jgi:hypothetical protein
MTETITVNGSSPRMRGTHFFHSAFRSTAYSFSE